LTLHGKRILLIIGGGIAAYKSLELIRRLHEHGASARAILTDAGSQFVTPLSVASLSGAPVYQDLFDLTQESEMGHIVLSRSADLIVVAPATADLLAKLAAGLAPDLASTALLATDKPVLLAPAMNVRMWSHAATQRNLAALKADGVHIVGPNDGEMACGEYGPGRMAEPEEIIDAIEAMLNPDRRLSGFKALVTAGPTQEPIDPVRFIANRSSGKQGYAIASALAGAGADTVLVSGPVDIAAPTGAKLIKVETARQMLAACEAALPVDIAVCAAAVADWRPATPANAKIKKQDNATRSIELTQNPDILATLAHHAKRPALVIGFAAETDDLIANAAAKLVRKNCDWVIANNVGGGSPAMGGDTNRVHLLTATDTEPWPELSKTEVARRLVDRIAAKFGKAAA
jgi:phosphopantothenoylcysteine decarboxylase/phosphopantothenate--cysteine ligase